MKTYIVQLENHDDVISTRDKISWSKAHRVLLVWPREGKVLERKVDLLLLQRYCQELGAQMAIISASSEVKANARELGISVFRSRERAQRSARWRVRGGVGSLRSVFREPRKPMTSVELRESRAALQERPRENRWVRLGLFPLGVFSFLALVLFFLPGATVTITPERRQQQISLPVWTGPAIKAANPSGGMPAHILTVVVEGRDQLPSSGTLLTPESAARGEVVLSNLSDQAVEVPAGAIVLTLGEKPQRFRITRAVVVPAGLGNTQSAPVEAVVPGSAGNVAFGKIRAMEGDVGLQVTVENPEPLRGGIDRSRPAPTQQDDQKLREKLLASLEKIALEELRTKVEPGQQLLEQSLQLRSVVEEFREPREPGQPADVLQLTLRVEFGAWYIVENDIQAVAQSALDANLPDAYRAVPGSLEFQLMLDESQQLESAESGRIQGQLTAQQQLKSAWSAADLIPAILGRRKSDAAMQLGAHMQSAAAPKIELYPAWWGRLPFLPARITLVEQ